MRPKHCFPIFVQESKRHWFAVKIWKNKEDLRKAIGEPDGDTIGICRTWKVCYFGNNRPDKRLIGEIHLCQGYMGSGIVTHEFTHALFHVMRTLRLKPKRSSGEDVSKEEERLCWIMGYMVCQFYKQGYSKRIFGTKNKTQISYYHD